MARLALILWTCLSLLWPQGAALAACDHAAADANACCASECTCCADGTDPKGCCCGSDEAPAEEHERAPAPANASTDLERALCLPGPQWIGSSTLLTQDPSPTRSAHHEVPRASGRCLLRQACRLRH